MKKYYEETMNNIQNFENEIEGCIQNDAPFVIEYHEKEDWTAETLLMRYELGLEADYEEFLKEGNLNDWQKTQFLFIANREIENGLFEEEK